MEYISSAKCTWRLVSFSKLTEKFYYSDGFNAGSLKWRIIVYPKGYCTVDSLAIFLEVSDSETLPAGWSRDAKFSISVISEVDNKNTVKQETNFKFNAKDFNRGFSPFMSLKQLKEPSRGYLVNDICTIIVEVSCSEKPVKEEKNSSAFAESDALFTDIQNLLELNASEQKSSSSYCAKEIAEAAKIFDQCLNMDIASVIKSGKVPEFKNSLLILLTTDVFPDDMGDRMTKIVADFVRDCNQYEIAHKDLQVLKENENSVFELKSTLKQLSFEFTPLRSLAEAVEQEIARLATQTTKRKAQVAQLRTKLDDLTARATKSKEALVSAEEKTKSSMMKKEQAEKTIVEFERSWEFLKDLRIPRA